MVVKKRAMSSPTQDTDGRKHLLPLHMSSGSSTAPLHVRTDDEYSSDSSGSWRSHYSNCSPKSSDILPTWTANPQSPTDDLISPYYAKKSVVVAGRKCNFPFFMIGMLLVGAAAMYTSRITLKNAAEQVSALESNKARIERQLRKAEGGIKQLKREVSALDVMIQKQQELDLATRGTSSASEKAAQQLAALQERLHSESREAKTLKESVQKASREEIISKYGSGGVHRVEMELVFPDGRVGPHTFVIELAPIDIMPHSVYTFLEMVSTGLLDGCSFILNALHVLKAAPLPYDGSSAAAKAKAFTAHGLESVAFKEYHESWPHRQYTVGFAADGSPSFYINTEDNTEIHEGDPCFGKVVEGFDAIRRLESSPTRNGIWFEQRIGIKKARLLKD